jgi:HAD superfamily hydrolase (TIGR01450 family)
MAWVLDLDGVVWLGDQPVPGAAEAVATLRERGERVLFLTNNSSMTVGEYVEKLARHRIAASPDDIVTSAQAAAQLVPPDARALVLGGPGIVEALEERGVADITVAGSGAPGAAAYDAVVMGWHRAFDFSMLQEATTAVFAGARLIGTNADSTYPTANGLIPGSGAILAAVAYATGVTPTVAGKPNEPIADLVRARLGGPPSVVVGDRADSDGAVARAMGCRFALVLTGVTKDPATADPSPDVVAADLAELVRLSTD